MMRNGCRLFLWIAAAILSAVFITPGLAGDLAPPEDASFLFEEVVAKPTLKPTLKPTSFVSSTDERVESSLDSSVRDLHEFAQIPSLPKPTVRLVFLVTLFAVLGGRHLWRRR